VGGRHAVLRTDDVLWRATELSHLLIGSPYAGRLHFSGPLFGTDVYNAFFEFNQDSEGCQRAASASMSPLPHAPVKVWVGLQ